MSKDKIKPISPKDIAKIKEILIPDEVIEAFNECISKHYNGDYSEFKQEEVTQLIINKLEISGKFDNVAPEFIRAKVFNDKWLDVESLYRQNGWNVEYDKPGYCESYPATFKFTRKAE